MAENQQPAIIEIEWIDSLILNSGEWMDLEDLQDHLSLKDMLHRSVGYLVAESDDAIALACSLNAQEDHPLNRISGGMVIPKTAITKTTVIREET